MAATDDSATLQYPGGELDLDIVHATEGADGIALGSLLSKTGYTTFDNGFVNTASCKSAITYIDGDAGILRYRGYPDRAARREVDLHRGELPADLRRAAEQGAAGRVHPPDPAAHDAARGPEAVLRRLSPQRPPDAGAVQRGQRALARTTRIRSTRRTTSRSSCPRSGCWPSCRRSPPTPTRSRSVSRSSTRTTR